MVARGRLKSMWLVVIPLLALGMARISHHPRSRATSPHQGLPGHATIRFIWDSEIRAGDCGTVNDTLYLNSDGTAHFSALVYTYSTHSGDYWWVAFEIQDAGQVTIQSVPFIKGPHMDDNGGSLAPPPRQHFLADFTFDSTKFGEIKYVLRSDKC